MSLIRSALGLVAEHLPSASGVFYSRRASGDLAITWAAQSLQALTGRPVQSIVDFPHLWDELIHPEDRSRVKGRLAVLPEVDQVEVEYRIISQDGEVRWVRDRMRVFRNRVGAPVEVVGILSDVTARRSLEGQVALLEERLWESQRVESVGALAGGIAHDFNNLLTAILSSVQLISEQPGLQQQAQQDLRVIRAAAERGGALARQILGFSSGAGREAGSLDLARSLREMEVILARTLGADIDLTVSVPEDLWPVQADGARFEQVLLNLVVNARDAMERGGRLEVRLENEKLLEPLLVEGGQQLPPGNYAVLAVRDTGSGIPGELRSRIFQPYVSTKEGKGGVGLGLATVLRIVRGYGGGIHLETASGSGSEFRVYLPAGRVPARPLHETVAAAVAPAEVGAVRVLVVEDDPGVRELVKRTLDRAGHHAVTAGSAAEALRIFDRVKPSFDVLLSDVVLPDRSGPELYRALTRRVPNLPVVFMSGYGEGVLESRGGPADAVFLQKPFTAQGLAATIRQALAARTHERGGAVEADPLKGEVGTG